MLVDNFDYDLPREAIAQVPLQQRDASRRLVTDPLQDSSFGKLPGFLRAGDLLVVNATRVRAARLIGRRPSGGAVELLLLAPRGDDWEALARPARKLTPGQALDFGEVTGEVVELDTGGRVVVHLRGEPTVEAAIARAGSAPYPPYIRSRPTDPERYQTIYGDRTASAAAPTAGLHFTTELLGRLKDGGIELVSIYLNIGLDTFRPITTSRLEDHVMHSESYEIPPLAAGRIAAAKTGGRRIVAVGTTVVRALESAAAGNAVAVGAGSTDLFIRPGFKPRVVDALVTNFHMPRSSLLVMVAALYPGWRRAYAHAVAEGYRFLSFGDAMFIPRLP